MRVLVVEDVDSMRELLRELLERQRGVRAGLAKNGAEARIELLRNRPDVVLLDEVLPGESSLDLLSEFQKAEIPVVLITGMDDPLRPIPEGAASRVVKPAWDTMDTDRVRLINELSHAIKAKSRLS